MPELTQLDRIEQKIDRLDRHINGGDQPAYGILIRVDRLEQAESQRKWWTRTALGAGVAGMVGTAWTFLTKS